MGLACRLIAKGQLHSSPQEVHIDFVKFSDTGSLIPTPGHVKFAKWSQVSYTGSFASYSQDHLTKLK